MTNPPDLKKLRFNCNCTTGRLSKLLAHNKYSKLVKRATHMWCTYVCLNCGAKWKAETWLRGAGWTDPKWSKIERGNRA